MTAPERLVSALAETHQALEAGDAVTAAAAMAEVVAACEEVQAAKGRLDPPVLEEAQRLLECCVSRASEVQPRLQGELSHAGLGRRAVAAYQKR